MKKRLFAGFAALCMAASLASAAFAETATPETARAEPPQVVEYSASDDATGFSAAAEAAPGVLPEGAKLTVVPLNETAEPEMASLLDGYAEPEAAGEYGERIAALDLAFKAQDQEVEPDGTVNVTIQLPGEIAAELQQAQELTLVHCVEQDGTTTPQKVESAVFADDCAKVSFETDSFSVYEIYATVPQDADGDNSNQADTYADDDYKKYIGTAAIYYLATPDGIPGSNDIGYWKPESDKSDLFGTIKTSGATWEQIESGTDRYGNPVYVDKNITTNVGSYITSWPDGTANGSAWTLKRGDPTSGTYFTKVLDSIWESYKESIQKATGVSSLDKVDVTEITLIPAKISRDNSTKVDQNYHIDCTISVKCDGVFTAKFWVKEPGAENYNPTPVDAKSYASGSKVEKTGKIEIGSTKEVNGVTYVLTGWYAEDDTTHGPKGKLVSTWPYTPTQAQLEDGTVNFYAEYVPMYSQVTVSKTVTGALGDKAKEFSFTLTVKDSNGNEITGEMKAKKGSAEEFTIKSGNTFTLKDGESITITNIPTGATFTVTENDYTGTNDGYTTSYVVDNGQSTGGLKAKLENISAGNHTIAFTNSKDVTPDTGITLHSMPYLLVLAGVLVGGMAWMRRRKRS